MDWNARYEAGDTPWDKGGPAPALLEWLEQNQMQGRVLVPGCGQGHDVRSIAAQTGVSAVIGADIAPLALKAARAMPQVGAEQYELVDFLDRAQCRTMGTFEWVFEHTCLCALEPPDRPSYATQLGRMLVPGGHLLAILFVEVEDYDGSGPPHPIRLSEAVDLFSEDFELLSQVVPTVHYPDRPFGAERLCCFRRRAQA